MRRAIWTDPSGRRWTTEIPDDAPDSDAEIGVPIGPPSLDFLDLPEALAVRLHNALHDRGLLTYEDVRRRRPDVSSAIISAAKLGVGEIVDGYHREAVG